MQRPLVPRVRWGLTLSLQTSLSLDVPRRIQGSIQCLRGMLSFGDVQSAVHAKRLVRSTEIAVGVLLFGMTISWYAIELQLTCADYIRRGRLSPLLWSFVTDGVVYFVVLVGFFLFHTTHTDTHSIAISVSLIRGLVPVCAFLKMQTKSLWGSGRF